MTSSIQILPLAKPKIKTTASIVRSFQYATDKQSILKALIRKTLIVIVLILSNQFCFSQNTDKNFIKDFALLIDTSGTPEFDSILPVGFTFQTENGKTKNIQSFTNEYAEAFDIHTENCKLINGYIHYDVNEVYKNGHKIKCEIVVANNE